MPTLIEDAEQPLTIPARAFFNDLYDDLCRLDERIEKTMQHLQSLMKHNEDYHRIQSVLGVGPVSAAAILACVGNGAGMRQFKKRRQFAAWLGLTPRHHASGESCRTGGIRKGGNVTLRTLFIHGARRVMNWAHKHDSHLHRWVQQLMVHKPASKVVVALANKLARIIWAVLGRGEHFNLQKA